MIITETGIRSGIDFEVKTAQVFDEKMNSNSHIDRLYESNPNYNGKEDNFLSKISRNKPDFFLKFFLKNDKSSEIGAIEINKK